MKPCEVTVVIPAYRCAATLPALLRAVSGQTLPAFELLVIDDGSPDETAAILQRYAAREPRLRVISTRNLGPAAGRNRGLAEAKGRYLTFWDADDLPSPHQLAALCVAARRTNAQVVCCGYRLLRVGRDGKKHAAIFSPPAAVTNTADDVAALLPALLAAQVWFPVWNKLYETAFLREQGLTFPHWRSGEDRQFNLALLPGLTRLCCLPEPFYRYFVRPGSSLSVRYLPERFSAALSANALLLQYGAAHAFDAAALRQAAGCLVRSAAAALAGLTGPDCPLSRSERRAAVRAMLANPDLQLALRRCRGRSATGLLARLLSLRSVSLARCTGAGLALCRRRAAGLFFRVKRGGSSCELP